LGWLGLAPENRLRNLERLNIGREHFSKQEYAKKPATLLKSAQSTINRIWNINPLRAHIAATYLNEMQSALESAVRSLKKGGHFVLVIGDNTVCGKPFATSSFMSEMIVALGLVKKLELVDHIRSRGLMTKRNKTAGGVICQEHIHVFQRPVTTP